MEQNSPFQKHEPLLTELFQRVLPHPDEAHSALKVLKKKYSTQVAKKSRFQNHELAWIIREAFRIVSAYQPHESKAHLAKLREIFSLEENPHPEKRLADLTSLISLLPMDQRFLIISTEVLGIPLSTLSTALGIPEESLKINWKQGMFSLKAWVWN